MRSSAHATGIDPHAAAGEQPTINQ